jgi:hypothetical protein
MARRLATPLLVLTVLTLAAAPAAAWSLFGGEDGNGELVETTVDVDPCHAIRLECGLDLEITLGDAQRVVLTMDENLVDNYRITERAGTLVIDAEDDPRPDGDARLQITLTALDALTIAGAGDVDLDRYRGERLEIRIGGAGDLDLAGEVGQLVVQLDGAGDIDARKLRARDAVVTVNGAGDVELYATDSADIELNGVGDVDVYGDPARFRRDVDGLGSIARK